MPDNQEVYLDRNGNTSVVFDVLERVTEFDTDEAAANFHLEDYVENGDDIRVWSRSPVRFGKIP